MRSSIRLGRIVGIEIGLHYSWFLVLALVSWSLSHEFLPDRYPGWATGTYWATGTLAAVLLFVSVLVHELAHSVVARARGFDVGEITLFILGGVSNLRADAKRPRDELVISAVGPATSLVLAGIFGVLVLAVGDGASPVAAIVWYLALINLLLGLFNLLPAFPLDGGRVLRSVVWAATGNHMRATTVATVGGQILGFVLMVFGAYQFLLGNQIGGIWLAFIGWFLQSTARRSQAEASGETGVRGLRVRDIMEQHPPTIDPNSTIAEAVFDHFLRRGVRSLPVCDGETLLGIISFTDVRRVPRDQWGDVRVRREMTPMPLRVVSPDDDLAQALELQARYAIHQLPVMEGGRLVGLLSRAHIIQYLYSARELHIK